MKHATRHWATIAAVATLAASAAAQQTSNLTTFVVPYQVNNSTGAPLAMMAECALFIGRRLVSEGRQNFVAAPGNSSGAVSVGMHWPLRENPSRINQFACRVIEQPVGGYRGISLPEPGGVFALPHAGLRSYVSGSWPL